MLKELKNSIACARSDGSGPKGLGRLLSRGARIVTSYLISKPPKKGIVMIHESRVGSTALGTLLDQQKALYWDGEIYTKLKKIEKHGYYEAMFQSSKLRESYLERRSQRSLGTPYGFEIKTSQLIHNDSSIKDELSMLVKSFPVCYFVILIRRNSLRHIISITKGIKTGAWHSGSPSNFKITINVKNAGEGTLVERLEKRSNARIAIANALNEIKHAPLCLSYEDDIMKNPNIGARKICEFVGINYKSNHSFVRKPNYQPLEELIQNIDEVRNALSGTDYYWMIDD